MMDVVKDAYDDWDRSASSSRTVTRPYPGGGNDYQISYEYGKGGSETENGRDTINRSGKNVEKRGTVTSFRSSKRCLRAGS